MHYNNINKKVIIFLILGFVAFLTLLILYINFEQKRLIDKKQALNKIEVFEKKMLEKYNGNHEIQNSYKNQIASLKEAVSKNEQYSQDKLEQKIEEIKNKITK
ncbi:hypothetical protein CSB11_00110 [Candidatus Campbellbacteria bacterium]|nr:MAG: hypothetical protein CSB11_00110 [Candidatus Campbellbacteria bacterium]